MRGRAGTMTHDYPRHWHGDVYAVMTRCLFDKAIRAKGGTNLPKPNYAINALLGVNATTSSTRNERSSLRVLSEETEQKGHAHVD
jgi:hypothetical protein